MDKINFKLDGSNEEAVMLLKEEIKRLEECKCLLCKHYIKSKPFVHKCKAYPNGIPQKIFNQDRRHIDCDNKEYHFEYYKDGDLK